MKTLALAAITLAALLTACSGGGAGSIPMGPSAAKPSSMHRDSVVSLGHYNVNLSDIVVAGVSSGADMATQLHFSYSANIKGEAIFAGSPFFCALGTSDAYWGLAYGPVYSADYALYSCSGTEYWSEGESPPLSTLESDTNNAAKDGYLDPVADLSGSKAWIFSGKDDSVVAQSVVKDAQSMLGHYGVSTTTNYTTAAEHGWVTPDVSSSSNPCNQLNSNYLINCGFDAEGQFLADFFGTLNPRNNGTLTGSYIQFDQTPYGGIDMDSTGWLYVPSNCASGASCKLVVALHGCEMGQQYIGTQFVQESGLNEWADTNSIIVLYPQAVSSSSPANDLGCWDWWDYSGTAYASNEGSQVGAIWKMIQQI